jgi:serine/threonine-protein kinase HipA
MSSPGVDPCNHVPQDRLYVWALVNPAQPTLVGELRLSQLVADVRHVHL